MSKADRITKDRPRIYAHSWTLSPVMPVVEAARFTADNGFQGLELNCNHLDFWPGMVGEGTFKELATIATGEGIGYAINGDSVLNPATRLPEQQGANDEMLKRMLDMAGRIGCGILCMHSGKVTELGDLERKGVPFHSERFDHEQVTRDGWQRAVETIARWADLAAPQGVKLMVENTVHVRHTAAATAQSLCEMVEAIGRSNVKVNFDTGHGFIGGGFMEEFEAIKAHIGHFHMEDARTHGVSEHLPLGEGKVDFRAIAGFMAAVDAVLALEIYAPDRPVEATLESCDYLLKLIGESSHKITHPKRK
jgi:sugar phosphate isomerase/epimerase